eukprot:TRINITY_DN66919_c8_g2_i7.p2 TRINITY_DN66919_c8_g2~~TRINITY_DN66919_c8_g2_i7.p2  ORF type:complete len:241 (+),score=63.08 TRINITY_DN66919_c8_g2_i7:782-1504(+)
MLLRQSVTTPTSQLLVNNVSGQVQYGSSNTGLAHSTSQHQNLRSFGSSTDVNRLALQAQMQQQQQLQLQQQQLQAQQAAAVQQQQQQQQLQLQQMSMWDTTPTSSSGLLQQPSYLGNQPLQPTPLVLGGTDSTGAMQPCIVCGRMGLPTHQRKSGNKCAECIGVSHSKNAALVVDQKNRMLNEMIAPGGGVAPAPEVAMVSKMHELEAKRKQHRLSKDDKKQLKALKGGGTGGFFKNLFA